MRTLRGIILGSLLSVVACGVAGATTLVQTFTLPPTQTDITGTQGTGTFEDFLTLCPTCGSNWLNSVTLSITVNGTTTIVLTNTDTVDSSNTFLYQTYSNLNLVGTAPSTDISDLFTDLGNNITSYAAGGGCTAVPGHAGEPGYLNMCNTGSVTYAPGQQITYGPITATDSSGVQNAVSVTPYDTTGTFTLGFQTATNQSFTGGGGQDSNSQTTKASATITVDYNYSIPGSAPEPATLFLMGSALVGVGLLRKRAKS